jgi:hypothetical protein
MAVTKEKIKITVGSVGFRTLDPEQNELPRAATKDLVLIGANGIAFSYIK